MKFLIVGSGGTGASIGGFLALNKEDVTFISRGKNLEAFKKNGLLLKSDITGENQIRNIKFVSEDEYDEKADVIFVCVKGYSVNDIIPVLEKASHEKTIIIPIMNGYNMGNTISSKLKSGIVLEGCMYISAFVDSPGTIIQLGKLFRVVFGAKENTEVDEEILNTIKEKMIDSKIKAIVSKNIARDTFKKFSFISAYAACGAFYDVAAGQIQKDDTIKETFVDLCKEIEMVGEKLNLDIDVDLVEKNTQIIFALTEDTTASMQKDIKANKQYELDTLIESPILLGKELGLELPVYTKVYEELLRRDKSKN